MPNRLILIMYLVVNVKKNEHQVNLWTHCGNTGSELNFIPIPFVSQM